MTAVQHTEKPQKQQDESGDEELSAVQTDHCAPLESARGGSQKSQRHRTSVSTMMSGWEDVVKMGSTARRRAGGDKKRCRTRGTAISGTNAHELVD